MRDKQAPSRQVKASGALIPSLAARGPVSGVISSYRLAGLLRPRFVHADAFLDDAQSLDRLKRRDKVGDQMGHTREEGYRSSTPMHEREDNIVAK
jgi:hypothetical protein